MGWRETWRETVESFLREVREPMLAGHADSVVGAIAAARAELETVEQELQVVEERRAHEQDAAALCARRQEQAERIGDRATADIAKRFRARHEEHAALLQRKEAVLREELTLASATLNELLDYVRVDATRRGDEPTSTADR